MRKLRKTKSSISLILCASLSACTIKPPDVPVFEYLQQYFWTDPTNGHIILKPSPACMKAIKEAECGHGVFIVSGKEIYVGESKTTHFNGKPWSQLKAESVYVPAVESYAPLVTYIINACKKMNCYDAVDRFKVKIDKLSATKTTSGGGAIVIEEGSK